jgi:hypothetical protein
MKVNVRRLEGGVTIVEIMVAMGIIAVFTSSIYWALTTLNRAAIANRLYTGAVAAAEIPINDFQTAPVVSGSIVGYSAGTTTGTAIIYTDPQYIVGGSMTLTATATITKTLSVTGSTNQLSASNSTRYNYYVYDVVLTYFYPNQGRPYSVEMKSLRTDAP